MNLPYDLKFFSNLLFNFDRKLNLLNQVYSSFEESKPFEG